MAKLNNIKDIQKIDKSGMADFILAMPDQIQESLSRIAKIDIPDDWKKVKKVCLCGMGGSAVANHVTSNLPLDQRKIPMQVVRDYEIPDWVDQNTLVVVTSHSGATAETISAFKYAADKQAKIFIVAETGQLEELGKKEGGIVCDYDTSVPPRAAFGYQFGFVWGLFKELGFVQGNLKPTLELIKKMNNKLKPEVEIDDNFAKQLAFCCLDRLPIIVSAGILKSVGWRWKTQINENANSFAFTEFLPEAMHNAVQGTDLPKRFQDDLIYLILENSFDPPQLINQFDKLKSVLTEKNIRFEAVQAEGNDVWSQKLSNLVIGDWVSYYLSVLNDVDPTPVETIERLKK